jgi:hypothetical protein
METSNLLLKVSEAFFVLFIVMGFSNQTIGLLLFFQNEERELKEVLSTTF